jgi:hypothetical protein
MVAISSGRDGRAKELGGSFRRKLVDMIPCETYGRTKYMSDRETGG